MDAPAPQTRVGVGVVVRRADGSILLGRRVAEPGRPLAIPGGRLDPGETVEACAARELAEETGLEVDVAHVRAFDAVLHRDPASSWLIAGVEVDAPPGAEPQVREPHKFAGFTWADPDALPAGLFPATAQLLARLSGSRPRS